MEIPIYNSDKKMLQLLKLLKVYGVIRFDTEFCESIGLLKQNLNNIKNGKNHFTAQHIEFAVKEYKIDANWIFGISDQIFRGNIKRHTLTKQG